MPAKLTSTTIFGKPQLALPRKASGTLCDPIEQALDVAAEIAQAFGLPTVGDHAKEEMPRQTIGGLAAEHRLSSCPQIAHQIDQAPMIIDKLTYAANLASIPQAPGHPRYAFAKGQR
jgi:hypothetical protein